MNPTQLLAHFDRIADAPDAIPRLRRFILDLAVRGKLVEQDPNDEPASELLKQIQADKKRLLKDCKLRGGTAITPLALDEAPYPIPESWAWVPFGEIMISRDGERIPVSKEERSTRAKSYDYYGASGVIDKIDDYLFDKPLLLIGEDGANLINRSTPIAFMARGKYWVNNHAHVLDGISEGFLRFIELHINAIDLKPYVTGTAQPKMNQAKMNSIPIALPPDAEQDRIVAKVDELMALCDRLEAAQAERESRRDRLASASLHRLNEPASEAAAFREDARFVLDNLTQLATRPEHIQQLRQTILNLAVRGKLVEQEFRDTPVSALLSQKMKLPDGHQRRRKILKKTSVDSPEELFSHIPASWEYTTIQTLYDLNVIIDYADGNHGSLYPRASEFGDAGVTFVTAKDIAGGRVLWDTCSKLNEDRARQLTKGWARGGDVLLTHNATVGRVAQVEPDFGRFLLGTSVTFYRLNPEVLDARFFYYVLKSPLWQGQLETIMAQTTRNQVSIQKQAFFRIVVPPPAEQHRIVAKLDELMGLCDRLETQLATTLAQTMKIDLGNSSRSSKKAQTQKQPEPSPTPEPTQPSQSTPRAESIDKTQPPQPKPPGDGVEFRYADMSMVYDAYFETTLLSALLRTFDGVDVRHPGIDEIFERKLQVADPVRTYPGVVTELGYAAIGAKVPSKTIRATLEKFQETDRWFKMLLTIMNAVETK